MTTPTNNTLYQVELVWNREFNWVKWRSPFKTIEEAVKEARLMEDSGDGARVKKTRITDPDGKIVWAYGKLVLPEKSPSTIQYANPDKSDLS